MQADHKGASRRAQEVTTPVLADGQYQAHSATNKIKGMIKLAEQGLISGFCPLLLFNIAFLHYQMSGEEIGQDLLITGDNTFISLPFVFYG